LPTLVIRIPNLEIFLFCQHNSTGGGNLELRQTVGASQYTKCGGCRGYYGNNINKFGKKKTIFIVEMCQNVSEEIRKKGQFVTNEV
jgi:hypothetical protein